MTFRKRPKRRSRTTTRAGSAPVELDRHVKVQFFAILEPLDLVCLLTGVVLAAAGVIPLVVLPSRVFVVAGQRFGLVLLATRVVLLLLPLDLVLVLVIVTAVVLRLERRLGRNPFS